jgi:hypothetical protein
MSSQPAPRLLPDDEDDAASYSAHISESVANALANTKCTHGNELHGKCISDDKVLKLFSAKLLPSRISYDMEPVLTEENYFFCSELTLPLPLSLSNGVFVCKRKENIKTVNVFNVILAHTWPLSIVERIFANHSAIRLFRLRTGTI